MTRQLVGSPENSYAYDLAGNRSSSVTNEATTSYLANSVNAYYSISGGGFQPPSPVYDANGNATTYPVKPLGSSSPASCVFSWDINNQQISATVGTDSATYQYDALGRRTKRSETIGGVTTNTWFLTNGWNVELEHDGSDYTKRQTWGLDLSNGLQDAGGVGGLVMVETLPSGAGSPVPSFPTYDGNGNITAWVNASGTVIARQRYDAYGNIIDQFGTAPSSYGFSTKPQEKLTGLLYYGYRYYDPLTGRWPSRDPIEEKGGINLYEFVGNDGVNRWDILGLAGGATKLGCCGSKPFTNKEERCCDGKTIYRPSRSAGGPRGKWDPFNGPCCLGKGDGSIGKNKTKTDREFGGDKEKCMNDCMTSHWQSFAGGIACGSAPGWWKIPACAALGAVCSSICDDTKCAP